MKNSTYLKELTDRLENQAIELTMLKKEYQDTLNQIGKNLRCFYNLPELIDEEKQAKIALIRSEKNSDALYRRKWLLKRKNRFSVLETANLENAHINENACRENYKQAVRKRDLAEEKVHKAISFISQILKHTATLNEEEIADFLVQKNINDESVVKAIKLQSQIVLKSQEIFQTKKELEKLQGSKKIAYTKQFTR